eukprot:3244452-Pleurochrysis_carterae.AAC.1
MHLVWEGAGVLVGRKERSSGRTFGVGGRWTAVGARGCQLDRGVCACKLGGAEEMGGSRWRR